MADNDLINDELERVYGLYGERMRQFRRGLYVLIVAGLALFVLIVVPFLTFRDQVAAMQAEEVALGKQLQDARRRVAETQASVSKLNELHSDVYVYAQQHRSYDLFKELEAEGARHDQRLDDLKREYAGTDDTALAAWVRGEAAVPPDLFWKTNHALNALGRDPCGWKTGTAYTACRLCDDFTRQNEQFGWQVGQLSAVDEPQRTAAQSDLGAVVTRACGWLVRGEPHWKTGEPLLPEHDDALRGWFSQDLQAYEERITALHGVVDELVPARAQEVERITAARAAVTARLGVLQTQLGRIASFDRLGTPVGDLPLGLGQIVLLFPVVLAFAFLVVANSYAGTVQLQRAFVRLCRKRDGAGEVMDASHIAAIAPLWLDRSDAFGARAVKWAILLVPFALTVANLVLIATTSALTAQLPDDSAIPPAAYLALYGATLALFIGTLWYIWRAGRETPGAAAGGEAGGLPPAGNGG